MGLLWMDTWFSFCFLSLEQSKLILISSLWTCYVFDLEHSPSWRPHDCLIFQVNSNFTRLRRAFANHSDQVRPGGTLSPTLSQHTFYLLCTYSNPRITDLLINWHIFLLHALPVGRLPGYGTLTLFSHISPGQRTMPGSYNKYLWS